MIKLTEWFSGDIKPVRIGFYQRKYNNGQRRKLKYLFSYWDGSHFLFSISCTGYSPFMDIPVSKFFYDLKISVYQGLEWRGLSF